MLFIKDHLFKSCTCVTIIQNTTPEWCSPLYDIGRHFFPSADILSSKKWRRCTVPVSRMCPNWVRRLNFYMRTASIQLSADIERWICWNVKDVVWSKMPVNFVSVQQAFSCITTMSIFRTSTFSTPSGSVTCWPVSSPFQKLTDLQNMVFKKNNSK